MGGSLLAFFLFALVVTVTPGPDTALVVRNTLREGRQAGVDSAVGICTGLMIWGLATVLGITVLLRASEAAYDVLRLAGALWLVGVGVRTLYGARRGGRRDDAVDVEPGVAGVDAWAEVALHGAVGALHGAVAPARSGAPTRARSGAPAGVRIGAPAGAGSAPRRRASYRTGLASNLLNPKVGVFYLTLLPQFVPGGAAVLPVTALFVAIHIVQGIAWLSLVAWLTSRARGLLGRGAWRRASERLTGVVLLGLGLRLAMERR
jgi:threonine/homoserine/homoserine lactone efflux protein